MVRKAINRYRAWRKKCKVWKEHGNHTKYHLVDDVFNIGDWTYGVPVVHRYDGETRLIIGKYCSIAAGVQIVLGGNHHMEWISTYAFYQESDKFDKWNDVEGGNYICRGDVVIGNDVWIGRNALILSGAVVGDGAVIGAGAVVAGNIPPYAVAVGNPAKVIKYRFNPEQIESLMLIKWWDWPEQKINEFLPLLCSSSVDGFIEKAKNC